jgi:ubiquinone/menaquinone biosynthesis C-methylase UbiE
LNQLSGSSALGRQASLPIGGKAAGFDAPTQLPRDETQRRAWQAANRSWWERHPMRYDWHEEVGAAPGTRAYFEEIDRRFLSSVGKYMPWRQRPFEQVIPFAQLADQHVLEIGVGQGTHAQLLAPHCRAFTGIDLTAHATEMTALRLRLHGLPGEVRRMDAEEMEFADASFDYIWSWGVIHHSANTRRIVEEMHRVLRPGGRCTAMVYHRSWWNFHLSALLRRLGDKAARRQPRLHHVVQGATDGAIARYYTSTEWRALTAGLFSVEAVRIYGLKAELIPLPRGRIKSAVERLVPNAAARLLTNRLRLGSLLVADMRKA